MKIRSIFLLSFLIQSVVCPMDLLCYPACDYPSPYNNFFFLHNSLYNSEKEMIDVINAKGFQMSVIDSEGCTMLDRAVQQNYTKAMQLLIDMGANVNSKSNRKKSPLHVAAENLSVEAAQLLLQCGARIDVFNQDCETPLFLAVQNFYGEISDRRIEMVDLLLNRGANPNIRKSNRYCPTVLFDTTSHSKPDIAKMLLAHRADIFVQNAIGNTVAEESTSVIKQILEKWERIQKLKKPKNRLVEMIALQIEEWKLTDLDGTLPDKFSAEFDQHVKAPGVLVKIEKLMNRQ